MRRSSMVLGCCVVLSVTLSSCSPAPQAGPGQENKRPGFLAVADDRTKGRGKLTVQLDYDSVEAAGFDPQTAVTARSWSIGSLVYEPLVTVDARFKVQPLLAESWTQPNPTTYVFKLREDAQFSNGRAVTPDDVVKSLKRLIASKGTFTGQLGPVKTVSATGPAEVTVELSEAYTPFLAALSNTPAAVLPMKEIEAGTVDIEKQMIGTGPFVLKKRKQDQYWNFAANPKYRKAKSLGISELRIEIVPQEATRLAAIRNGSAGFAFFNNVDSMEQLSGARNAKVVNQQNSDFYYLIQNSRNPKSPLADRETRFALNTALDRSQIARVALGGRAQPTAVTPTVLPGACDPAERPAHQAGPEGAKAALKAAGVKNLKLRLALYNTEPALAQIAQVIQQQYAKAGVEVTIDKFDDSTFSERVFGAEPDFDLALGWFAGYTDPSMVSRWWNPEVAGFSSVFLNKDEKLNALISKASAQAPGAARIRTLAEVCDRVDTNSEMIPLVNRPGVIGFRTDRVSPTLQSSEGFGNILRNVAEYTVPGAK